MTETDESYSDWTSSADSTNHSPLSSSTDEHKVPISITISEFQKIINKACMKNALLKDELESYEKWVEDAKEEISNYFIGSETASTYETYSSGAYDYEEESDESSSSSFNETDEEEAPTKNRISYSTLKITSPSSAAKQPAPTRPHINVPISSFTVSKPIVQPKPPVPALTLIPANTVEFPILKVR